VNIKGKMFFEKNVDWSPSSPEKFVIIIWVWKGELKIGK
jgi:hypothetical protein